ncbi:Rib/alpha-like domain-containing protein, partial [Streptococcus danieliae]
EKSVSNLGDLPTGTTVAFESPVDTSTAGDKPATVLVTYPDGSQDKVPVTVKVVETPSQADSNQPSPATPTVKVGESVDPSKSISNLGDLPTGTTVAFESPVDTSTAGDKPATVLVTYPDGSQDKVPVTVKVVETPSQADSNEPIPATPTVKVGESVDPSKSISNLGDLPTGTTVAFESPVDTSTAGDKPATVLVTYPDGSQDKVPVTVKIVDNPSQADSNEPIPVTPTVKVGESVDPSKSISNLGDLPTGTTVAFESPVDTSTAGDKPATVLVTYPDGSQDKVPVTVKVVETPSQADSNQPSPATPTVKVGESVDPSKSISNLGDLPTGTTVAFESPVDTSTAGDKPATVLVTYPDGSQDKVPVTVKVVETPSQADSNEPIPATPTVKVGESVDPSKSISNLGDLPTGTTVAFESPVDTSTAGDKPATVLVTYPDGSQDKVPVTVKIVDNPSQADSNEPIPVTPTVKVGESVDPSKSISNLGDLPTGTTVAFESPVDTSTAGDKPATVLVTYPDGSQDKVPVTVKVVETPSQADSNQPSPADQTVTVGETPSAEKSISNLGDLPTGTTVAFESPVDTSTAGDKPATVLVTYPDGSQDKVSVTVKVVLPATDESSQDHSDKNSDRIPSTGVEQKTASLESKPQVDSDVAVQGNLPNTGEEATSGAMALGIGMLLAAVGLKSRRRREED